MSMTPEGSEIQRTSVAAEARQFPVPFLNEIEAQPSQVTALPPKQKHQLQEKQQPNREHGRRGSIDSVAAMSIVSFASGSSDPTKNFAVKNLQFLNDSEMENGQSAILGRGSFSIVRLARRIIPVPPSRQMSEMSSLSFVSDDNEEGDDVEVTVGRSQQPTTSTSRRLSGHQASFRTKHSRGRSDRSELVAVKILQKSHLKNCRTIERDDDNNMLVRTALENTEREIAFMKMLRHPNLVYLHEVIDIAESDRLYMVIEYVSLGEIMSNLEGTDRYRRRSSREGEPKHSGVTHDGHFDEQHSALYFVDIIHGLAHLHRHHIVHRDLKPENILMHPKGFVKICDFGVSHLFEDEKENATGNPEDVVIAVVEESTHLSRRESEAALLMTNMSHRGLLTKTEGTWCFWSPEMCAENSLLFSGYSCDIWAAGVCLYILATGRLPFFSNSPIALFDMIAAAHVNFDELGLSRVLGDLLRKVLAKDPALRFGLGDCLKHPFSVSAREQRVRELGDVQKLQKKIVVGTKDVSEAFSHTKATGARSPSNGFGKKLHQVQKRLARRSTEGLDTENLPTTRPLRSSLRTSFRSRITKKGDDSHQLTVQRKEEDPSPSNGTACVIQ